MTAAIIVDIDGTLADVEHRRHHVSGGNKNWKAFFNAMKDDPPVYGVVDFVEGVGALAPGIALVICTGRPEEYRRVTEKWLAEHCPQLWHLTGSEQLLMRPTGDYSPDVEVKQEMLRLIRARGLDPQWAIDDRQSVVDMWRREGLTCFQCAPGDWEERSAKPEPGTLHLMVGPSGAGKTLHAYRYFNSSQIVSSDVLRAEINKGDFQDQSKNQQVFAALHALVKTRIENGLDTVVDATNIRNRDRRAICDLMPENCHIFYHVVDRPLDQKHRDAGWRADVRVKDGRLLIDAHHQTFQSNLYDILNGDGDPRVTIVDVRPHFRVVEGEYHE